MRALWAAGFRVSEKGSEVVWGDTGEGAGARPRCLLLLWKLGSCAGRGAEEGVCRTKAGRAAAAASGQGGQAVQNPMEPADRVLGGAPVPGQRAVQGEASAACVHRPGG